MNNKINAHLNSKYFKFPSLSPEISRLFILSNDKKGKASRVEKDEREASIINAKKEADFIKSKFPNYQGEVISLLYDIETGKVS